MPLSPDELEIWNQQIEGLDDPSVELEPIQLRIDLPIHNTYHIRAAIFKDYKGKRISADEAQRAYRFVNIINSLPDPMALIKKLPKDVDEVDGPLLTLSFPSSEPNDQA